MRSKVIIDGEKDKIFPTLERGNKYFQKRKKELRKTLTLIMLAKEIKPDYWIGSKRN